MFALRRVIRYIPEAVRPTKGGRTDGTRSDPQVPVPDGVRGRPGVRLAGGSRQLAEGLIEQGPGGSGEPPTPEASRRPLSIETNDLTVDLPSERRIYRLGESVFRVWVTQPAAGAEYFKGGKWVWTPIPSGSIMDHPHSQELTAEEFEALRAGASAPLDPAPKKPPPRGMRP